ncbi:flagellar filament capping protein FliD [Candidatus Regiella endosymbiont of Tuberolachnus salignus]|uniref:flagellar filament capping protein FliD n=1 Tax=Candidatus Regiella endosymbiont of Tuberolachnus salignus TaxID=3077956 RepID=UPI0030D4A0FF
MDNNISGFNINDPKFKNQAKEMAAKQFHFQSARLEKERKNFQVEEKRWQGLKEKLETFRDDLNALNDAAMVQNSLSSSDPQDEYVRISHDSKAIRSSHTVEVIALASEHKIIYKSLDDDQIAKASGLLTLAINSKSFEIDLSALQNKTLEGLQQAINTHPDNKGIVALIYRLDGKKTFSLASSESGIANTMSVSSSLLTGGEERQARDARVSIDGQETSNPSNQFDDIVSGFSIELKKLTGSSPVSFSLSLDTSATTQQVEKFVQAYNALDAVGDEHIMKLKRSCLDEIRELKTRVVQIERSGKLTVDKNLVTLLKQNPNALTTIFNGENGLVNRMINKLSVYFDPPKNIKGGEGLLQSNFRRLANKDKALTAKEEEHKKALEQFEAKSEARLKKIEINTRNSENLIKAYFPSRH